MFGGLWFSGPLKDEIWLFLKSQFWWFLLWKSFESVWTTTISKLISEPTSEYITLCIFQMSQVLQSYWKNANHFLMVCVYCVCARSVKTAYAAHLVFTLHSKSFPYCALRNSIQTYHHIGKGWLFVFEGREIWIWNTVWCVSLRNAYYFAASW